MSANQQIAGLLRQLSTLMELKGENAFRVRAYAGAARTIETLGTPVEELAAQEKLQSVPGIGPGLAALIADFLQRGTSPELEELRAALPPGLIDLLKVQGLGPKKIRALHQQLGIHTLDGLEAACQQGRISQLRGFGAKTQENILRSIEQLRQYQGLFRLDAAREAGAALLEALAPQAGRLELAGSLRRCLEVVEGIELVASASHPDRLRQAFYAGGARLSEETILLPGGLPAALHLAGEAEFPGALLHFTGSQAHLEQLRARARSLGLRLEATGLFRGAEPLPVGAESELFAALGLEFIPPELREGQGELEAAAHGALPRLVRREDLRGALHVHTTYSDGEDSLEEMARAARERGYAYLGICDHSRSAAYANGLQVEEIRQQHRQIEALNEQLAPFRIFKGIESDILADGALDYDDQVLDSFDFVVISVHSRFNLDRQAMTRRFLRALSHPAAAIVGHPTGRLLLEREGYAVDLDAIIEAAAAHRVAIELNADPHRLDLDWRHLRQARDRGVPIAVDTDAHRIGDLDYAELGISLARKGWLQPQDVLNTLDADSLAAWFAQSKSG